ncbi:hypothetical protein GCM10022600_01040 [Qipengyuania pelagi]
MIHLGAVHGGFRLGSRFACSICNRMPHCAMALGFLFALCLGVGLRLDTLLRFRRRMTGMLRRRRGGEN